MRKHVLFLLALSSFFTAAYAQDLPTHEYTLKNGLKLVVREDHRTPVATVQIWYKVGSSYEHNGITGVSHLLEHMLFKGTEKYPEGQFVDIITKHGGSLNAFTSYDFTGYYESLPIQQVDLALELEADRMRNIQFTQEAFNTELQVVIEERRLRTDDNPNAVAYERFMATALTNSTYRNPIIGWPDDLKNAQKSDALDWYKTWYSPNNATVVIVGDVDPKETFLKVKRHFEDIKKSPLPDLKPQTEVKALGEKVLTVKRPASVPAIYMGYLTPVVNDKDNLKEAAALSLLATVLDGGMSSRFEEHLVRDQKIAAGISADYNPFMRQADLFVISATPFNGTDIQTVQDAILKELKQLQNELVTPSELARAKTQFKAHDIYEQDSISTQAMEIGSLESVGVTWHIKPDFLHALDRVDANDIQAVAQKYFNADQLTVGYLQPISLNTP